MSSDENKYYAFMAPIKGVLGCCCCLPIFLICSGMFLSVIAGALIFHDYLKLKRFKAANEWQCQDIADQFYEEVADDISESWENEWAEKIFGGLVERGVEAISEEVGIHEDFLNHCPCAYSGADAQCILDGDGDMESRFDQCVYDNPVSMDTMAARTWIDDALGKERCPTKSESVIGSIYESNPIRLLE